MAVTPVPNTYPGFIFDGENSRTYGVYITDVTVFGTPEREVELLTIPGRNGDYALDKGRWANITVRYECALPTEDPADFVTGVAAFRNMLASRIGYKRLEDEINTTEYRMALFSAGIDVNTLNKEAGTFAVDFECKPQRFLTAGETAQTVTSGGTITNPTLYESKPLLVAEGLGNIEIGGGTITITNAVVGNVILSGVVSQTITSDGNIEYIISQLSATDSLNNGDTITVPSVRMVYTHTMANTITTAAVDAQTNCTVTVSRSGKTATFTVTLNPEDFSYKTSGNGLYCTFDYRTATSDETDQNSVELQVQYVQPDTIRVMVYPVTGDKYTVKIPRVNGYSTKSTLPDQIYIDLDIGEAFYYDADGNIISLNNVVNIPVQLPTLPPGADTITYDNTITALAVTPRWWQL